jgi:hypothetical protein
MHKLYVFLLAAPFVCACAGSMPAPTQRLADAQSAERSARELGAENVPAAKLSLSLAQEQIAQAKAGIADGDNERADSLLIRAKADAELSLAQARQQVAMVGGQAAVDAAAEQKATNVVQGAVK